MLAPFILFSPADTSANDNKAQAIVRWVIDGDTFQLDTGERVRFIGIDAPEYRPWAHRADFYGKEAFLYTKNLLKNKMVLLEKDVQKHDKYDRTLAYVYLEDGTFVNRLLAEEGYAQAKNYPPNGRYQKRLKEAEWKAKDLKKGMWARIS